MGILEKSDFQKVEKKVEEKKKTIDSGKDFQKID